MAAVARFRLSDSPGAWSAVSPPAQYGERCGGVLSVGAAAVGSRAQKAEPGSRSWTIAVTTAVVLPVEVNRRRLPPGRSPRRLAVCVVAATPTAPGGTGPAYDPATTCA